MQESVDQVAMGEQVAGVGMPQQVPARLAVMEVLVATAPVVALPALEEVSISTWVPLLLPKVLSVRMVPGMEWPGARLDQGAPVEMVNLCRCHRWQRWSRWKCGIVISAGDGGTGGAVSIRTNGAVTITNVTLDENGTGSSSSGSVGADGGDGGRGGDGPTDGNGGTVVMQEMGELAATVDQVERSICMARVPP